MGTSAVISSFPDAEMALLFFLGPLFPGVRFTTSVPAGDLTQITARIHRTSGANRDIYQDRPIIDIDVFGPATQHGQTSQAARDIQAEILSIASAIVTNGVMGRATSIVGPRQLPEVNVNVVRYSATYEIQIHA
jgi:hypothetical protein